MFPWNVKGKGKGSYGRFADPNATEAPEPDIPNFDDPEVYKEYMRRKKEGKKPSAAGSPLSSPNAQSPQNFGQVQVQAVQYAHVPFDPALAQPQAVVYADAPVVQTAQPIMMYAQPQPSPTAAGGVPPQQVASPKAAPPAASPASPTPAPPTDAAPAPPRAQASPGVSPALAAAAAQRPTPTPAAGSPAAATGAPASKAAAVPAHVVAEEAPQVPARRNSVSSRDKRRERAAQNAQNRLSMPPETIIPVLPADSGVVFQVLKAERPSSRGAGGGGGAAEPMSPSRGVQPSLASPTAAAPAGGRALPGTPTSAGPGAASPGPARAAAGAAPTGAPGTRPPDEASKKFDEYLDMFT